MLQELRKSVSECGAGILYQPLKGETDYRNGSFPLKIPVNNLTLPNDRDSDPFEWAVRCIAKFKKIRPYILIPGTRFDVYGTRHGRGAGWYDRFLSKVPTGWLKIGLADQFRMSQKKLLRQLWDQPVDWVLVYDHSTWSVYKITID